MQIKENEIHVWHINLNDLIDYQRARTFLTKSEQLRTHNFLSEELKKQYIIYHYATHEILSYYLNIPAKDIPIIYSKFHKPFLESNPFQLEFNLSHSHDNALLGISKKNRIGVDIEKIRAIENQSAIEKMVLTQNEQKWLSYCAPSLRLKNFYRLWTSKESLLKGIGEGFHFGVENIEFKLQDSLAEPNNLFIYSYPDESPQWTVQNFILQDKFMGAFATKQPVHSVSQFKWDHSLNNDLMKRSTL